MLEQIKSFVLDPDTRNFVLGVLAVGLVYYIVKGVDSTEKFHRLFKSVLVVVFVVVVFALLYGFSK